MSMSPLLLVIPTPRTYTLFIFIWGCRLLEFHLDMLASDPLIFYFKDVRSLIYSRDTSEL